MPPKAPLNPILAKLGNASWLVGGIVLASGGLYRQEWFSSPKEQASAGSQAVVSAVGVPKVVHNHQDSSQLEGQEKVDESNAKNESEQWN